LISSILSDIICQTFIKHVGKNQNKCDKKYGMCVSFILGRNKKIHLLIFAFTNYVGVYSQVSNKKTMELLCYHDSCWRQAVESFIASISDEVQILGNRNFHDWYDQIEISEEHEEYLNNLKHNRDRANDKAYKEKRIKNPFEWR